MHLLTASLALSLAWVFWTYIYLAHRGAAPAAWTRSETLSMLAAVVLIMMAALGLGSAIAVLLSPLDALAGQSAATGAALLGAPVAAWAAARALRGLGGSVAPAPKVQA